MELAVSNQNKPPGARTRATSSKQRSRSITCSRTEFAITISNELAGKGIASALPGTTGQAMLSESDSFCAVASAAGYGSTPTDEYPNSAKPIVRPPAAAPSSRSLRPLLSPCIASKRADRVDAYRLASSSFSFTSSRLRVSVAFVKISIGQFLDRISLTSRLLMQVINLVTDATIGPSALARESRLRAISRLGRKDRFARSDSGLRCLRKIHPQSSCAHFAVG